MGLHGHGWANWAERVDRGYMDQVVVARPAGLTSAFTFRYCQSTSRQPARANITSHWPGLMPHRVGLALGLGVRDLGRLRGAIMWVGNLG